MLILFVILNLINVILGTMRSILTVKASPTVAMLINTISYTFNSCIVKLITNQSFAIVLITTAATNIIGVYIAKYLVNFGKKDSLWVVDVTTQKNNSIQRDLDLLKIQYSVFNISNSDYCNIRLYSYSKTDSRRIKKVLSLYNVKYNIVETKGTF